jgi:hypothetical protein
MRGEVALLRAENRRLKKEISRLKKRIRELEAQALVPRNNVRGDWSTPEGARPSGEEPNITPGHEPPPPFPAG